VVAPAEPRSQRDLTHQLLKVGIPVTLDELDCAALPPERPLVHASVPSHSDQAAQVGLDL
jgi:hypothetical protein